MPHIASCLIFALSLSASARSEAETAPGKVYVYKQSAGKPRQMEIYFPPGHDAAKVKVPGLILFHGGAWSGGTLAQFRTACDYFASRGLVCAAAEYRMLTKAETAALPPGETKKRACVTDAKSAIRWFKEHAEELGIDPARVITGGGSAGGHISALATLNPGLNDPADPEGTDTSVVAYLWFNPAFSPDDVKDAEIDVLRYLKKDLAPAITFFGTEDTWKKGWDAASTTFGKLGGTSIDLRLAEGQAHGFFNKDPWQSVTLIAADRFLAGLGLLKGEPTLPAPASGETLVKADLSSGAAADPVATTTSDWKGFSKLSFDFEGHKAFVVVPREVAPGHPWVWRTSFPDFHAEVDLELLKGGFHVAHVDVVSMLGCDESLAIMDRFYDLVRSQWSLAAKPALEGVSRGGLHAYRYAATRPDRVACLYADTPVMDLKSWPLKSPQAKGQVADAIKFYGFADEAALVAYAGDPLDLLEPIVKAKIPLRHVISTNDTVVPAEDNTLEARRRIEKLGGSIDVLIVDPTTTINGGHHFPLVGIEDSVVFIKQHAGAGAAQ